MQALVVIILEGLCEMEQEVQELSKTHSHLLKEVYLPAVGKLVAWLVHFQEVSLILLPL